MNTIAEIMQPIAVLAAWTMVMWVWMYVTRIPAMTAAKVDADALVRQGGQSLDQLLPAKTQWKAHNYNHLHEAPTVFYAVALALALIDAAVWLAGGGIIAHVGIAAAAMQAAWQLARFQPDNGARCLELFRSNRIFGLIITLGFLLDSLLT